jgi:5-methylcytosine-specific restriction endonuclease McrA
MEIYSCPIPGSIRRYTRYVRLGLEELPDYSHKEHRHINIAGYNLNCKSARMRLLFLNRNLTCRCCGIKASFAAIETCPSSKGYKSLNFYGYDPDGKEVLLTWDHIVPRSKGGKSSLENSQTLCAQCNGIKGNELHFREIRAIRKMRGLPVKYEYHDDGEIIYWWDGKTYSTNRN